jgi:hypothetical protein
MHPRLRQYTSPVAGIRTNFHLPILASMAIHLIHPWSREVKYLGVTLNNRLTFASHTAKCIQKSEKAFHILYSFLRKLRLNSHNKLLFYKRRHAFVLSYAMECKLGFTVPTLTEESSK